MFYRLIFKITSLSMLPSIASATSASVPLTFTSCEPGSKSDVKTPSKCEASPIKTSIDVAVSDISFQCLAQAPISRLPIKQEALNEYTSTLKFNPDAVRKIETPALFRFPTGNLIVGDQLGYGAFGVVHRAQLQPNDGATFFNLALKFNKIKDSEFSTEFARDSIQKEITALKKIKEYDPEGKLPFIKYIIRFQYGNFSFLGTTLCCENLYQRINKIRDFSLLDTHTIAKQLASGLEFLSRQEIGIAHCDLKPQNVLLKKRDSLEVRIADFGASRSVPDPNTNSQYLVTRWYRPPELLLRLPFDHSVDIWSMGCTLYYAYTEKVLFEAESELDLLNMFIHFLGPIPKEMALEAASKKINILVPCSDNPNFYDLAPRYKTQSGANLRAEFERQLALRPAQSESYTPQDFKELLEGIFKWSPNERMGIDAIVENLAFKKPNYIEQNQTHNMSGNFSPILKANPEEENVLKSG